MTSRSKRMAELFNNSPVEPDKKKRSLEKRLQEDVGTLEEQDKAVTPQQEPSIRSDSRSNCEYCHKLCNRNDRYKE